MTEDEAKTKWCPAYRVCGSDPLDNRPWESVGGKMVRDSIAPESRCIGSACMAWRPSRQQTHADAAIHGFCGLAGSPQ